MTNSSWGDFFGDLLFAAFVGLLAGAGVYLALDWAGFAPMADRLGAALAGLVVAGITLWRRLGSEHVPSRWRSDRYDRDDRRTWDTTSPGDFVASVVADIVVNVLDD